MFWKKKNKQDLSPSRLINTPFDSRNAFRISPDPRDPVFIKIGNKKIIPIEISSTGFSFNGKSFKSKIIYPILLKLPNYPHVIEAKAKIISIDRRIICHCTFIDLSEEIGNVIHRYILNRQKKEIRSKKQ